MCFMWRAANLLGSSRQKSFLHAGSWGWILGLKNRCLLRMWETIKSWRYAIKKKRDTVVLWVPRWSCRNCGSGFLRVGRVAPFSITLESPVNLLRYSPWEGLSEEITLKEISTGISVEEDLLLVLIDLAYFKKINKIEQELEWPWKKPVKPRPPPPPNPQ